MAKNKKRILIMDDEIMIVQSLKEILESLGYEVDFCSAGNKAFSKYFQAQKEKNPFDVIILDLIVKDGWGGKETIKKIMKKDKNVKAIVSSGYSGESAMAEFKNLGFKEALPKPYTWADLKKILDKVIAN